MGTLSVQYTSGMDARAVARAAKIDVNTLNSWVQRGQVRGMSTGSRGRRRDFDLDTATRVAIVAELVQLGMAAKTAVFAAGRPEDRLFPLLLVFATRERIEESGRWPAGIRWFGLSSAAQIPEVIEQYFSDDPPSSYAVINVDVLRDRMRRAEEEWQRHHGAKD